MVSSSVTTCVTTNSNVSIVSSNGNKYRFNGDTTYTSDLSYGFYIGTYTITGIPEAHPIAFLNSGKTNNITYMPVSNTSAPIIIKVSGGSTSTNGYNDYYTFRDVNNNPIYLGNGSFKFMRGKTYRFTNNGIICIRSIL